MLETIVAMPTYLLKPEMLGLPDAQNDARYRLIMDLMWVIGARVSEVLALTWASFIDDGLNFGVFLQTLE